MKESVIYQEILLEGEAKGISNGIAEGIAKGEAKGLTKGLTKGKAEERNQIALKMLRSNVPVESIAEFTGLTLKQIEKLQKTALKLPRVRKITRPSRSPKQ